jgi:hypothetical protein
VPHFRCIPFPEIPLIRNAFDSIQRLTRMCRSVAASHQEATVVGASKLHFRPMKGNHGWVCSPFSFWTDRSYSRFPRPFLLCQSGSSIKLWLRRRNKIGRFTLVRNCVRGSQTKTGTTLISLQVKCNSRFCSFDHICASSIARSCAISGCQVSNLKVVMFASVRRLELRVELVTRISDGSHE